MTKVKTVLLSNPKTGRYSSRRPSIEKVAAYLETLGVPVDLHLTTRSGDATRIAAAAARDGAKTIIVAGGDGTINEALQGIIGTNTRLGIIPRGTANVMARELGLPLDCMAAAKVIAQGTTQRIHVGCATDEVKGDKRYFFLMAGIGLDASVVRRVHPRLKKYFGKGAFWLSGLSHLANWQPHKFQVEINQERLEATFAAIGKAASYGGDLAVTPRAKLDKPDFEICVISSRSRLRYLHLLAYVIRGGVPANKSEVRFLRSSEARAFGDVPVQVDGELIGKLPLRFSIAPETVEVVC